jgi:hypothetical protein
MALTFDQLDAQACRWPVGLDEAAAAHLFCGAPCQSGSPYCPDHHRLATEPLRRLDHADR